MMDALQIAPADLQAGQVLGQDVMAGSMVWLREGTVLNEAAIERLRRMNLEYVLIHRSVVEDENASELPAESAARAVEIAPPDFRKLSDEESVSWMSSEHFSRPVEHNQPGAAEEQMFAAQKTQIREQAGFKEMIPSSVDTKVRKGLQASMISSAMRNRIDLERINHQADELSEHLVGNGRGYIRMEDINTYGEHLTARTVMSSKLFHLTRGNPQDSDIRDHVRCQFMMQGMYTMLPDNLQQPMLEMQVQDRRTLRDTLLEYCEWIKSSTDVDSTVMENVMLQHERFDGLGLPHGYSGEQIPEDSHTWALATAYSSSIFSRPGQRRLSPREAADNLIRQSGTSYGSTAVNMFLRRFGYFPNGSLVRLNTGELALVRRQVERSMFKPVVCRLDSENQPLPETELAAESGIFIRGSVLEY
ncbi:MAG: hypothetical protein H7A35_05640 [Planctomycetales bacterium]|nr:hypothetical protein [bacterium]UNM09541.1 MAG: hypothetical protein H7A35_05640 [Planctomycetales bacterium]